MWLLLTASAAVIASVLWYAGAPHDPYRFGFLSLLLWGATIMWSVDHVIAYAQEGGAFVEVNADATALGLSTLLLAAGVWLVALLVRGHGRIPGSARRK